MKKIALSLAVLMVFSLAGCKKELPAENSSDSTAETSLVETSAGEASAGDDSSSEAEAELVPEEGAELLFWSDYSDFATEIADKFKEKYGVTVNTEQIGLNIHEKIALDGPAGTGADVFMSSHDKTPELLNSGLITPIDNSIKGSLEQTINPTALKTIISDDKMYGVPVSVETDVLLYNKNLVKGEPANTVEQIFEEAKTFNDTKENKYWYLFKVSDGAAMYPWLSAAGFNLFGADGTDNDNPGFDTPEFTNGLTNIKNLKENMPLKAGDLTLANSDFISSQFIADKTAYMIGGPWNVKSFRDQNVEFGVAPMPTYNGNKLCPFAYMQIAYVSAYSKYPNAAQLFAEFLASEEAGSLLYSTENKITSLKDISKIEGLSTDEYLMPINEQIANAFPMPSVERMNNYWTISGSIGPAVFDGDLTPEEAAAKAVKDWDDLIKSE